MVLERGRGGHLCQSWVWGLCQAGGEPLHGPAACLPGPPAAIPELPLRAASLYPSYLSSPILLPLGQGPPSAKGGLKEQHGPLFPMLEGEGTEGLKLAGLVFLANFHDPLYRWHVCKMALEEARFSCCILRGFADSSP